MTKTLKNPNDDTIKIEVIGGKKYIVQRRGKTRVFMSRWTKTNTLKLAIKRFKSTTTTGEQRNSILKDTQHEFFKGKGAKGYKGKTTTDLKQFNIRKGKVRYVQAHTKFGKEDVFVSVRADKGAKVEDVKAEATILLKQMVGSKIRQRRGMHDTYDLGLGDKHFKQNKKKKITFSVASYS